MDDIMRSVDEVEEPEVLVTSLAYRIRLLQIASYKAFEQKVSGYGSAPRYFGMLKLIEANPGIPQTRLAEAIFLDRSSLVPIVDTLTREGWLERKLDARDRRVRRVFLTDAGAARVAALQHEVDAHEAMITAGLSATDKAQLLTLLEAVDANLRADKAEAP